MCTLLTAARGHEFLGALLGEATVHHWGILEILGSTAEMRCCQSPLFEELAERGVKPLKIATEASFDVDGVNLLAMHMAGRTATRFQGCDLSSPPAGSY